MSVAMCIHRNNRESLRYTANYLAELGVSHLRLNAPQEVGVWKRYADEYALAEDEVWETYRAYIPQYFADGAPIGIELDGYFRCGKASTDYRVSYLHHPGDNPDWERIPYCESMRHNMYIGPDRRCCWFFKHVGAEGVREVADAAIREYGARIEHHGNTQETVWEGSCQ